MSLSDIRRIAGQKGGRAAHKTRGFQCLPTDKVKEIAMKGVAARRIKEVDDLELVRCPKCMSQSKLGGVNEYCARCKGTGDVVVQQTKYYTQESRERSRRK